MSSHLDAGRASDVSGPFDMDDAPTGSSEGLGRKPSTGPLEELPTTPLNQPTKRPHDESSDEEEFDDHIALNLSEMQLDPTPNTIEPPPTDVGSDAEDAAEPVTCDLETLSGETFTTWINRPKIFAETILRTSYSIIEELTVEDAMISDAFEVLSRYAEITKRSATLKLVLQQIDEIGEVKLILAKTDEVYSTWSAAAHWARLLVIIRSIVADNETSMFQKAKIRPGHATYGCLWVLSKIIARNRRPADFRRLTKKLANRSTKATQAAILSATQGATFGLSHVENAQAAKSTVDRLNSRGAPKSKGKATKRPKLSAAIVENSSDDEELFDPNAPPEPEAEPEEPAEPIVIQGMTEEDIIQSYVRDMDKEATKKSESKDQKARQEKAAKSLLAHSQSLRLRDSERLTYLRNLQLLYVCGQEHFGDIKSIKKPNKFLNPIRKQAKAEFELQKELIRPISKQVEETAPASADVLALLNREEQAEVNGRAATSGTTEEELPCMVELPDEAQQDASTDLFRSSRSNQKFSPSYLGAACIEAKITDLNKKLMPGMTFPLRWWQVIATKWATDLLKYQPHVRGGIIADMIGLGKTVQAGACIQKIINEYRDARDPALDEFRKMHPPFKRPEGSPERPGDLSRPSLYITSASLCHQTAKELAQMSKDFEVILVGGDASASGGTYKTLGNLPGFEGNEQLVWDTDDAKNIRKVYVISYNVLAKYYGPQAYWTAVNTDLPRYCNELGFDERTFDWHKHVEDAGNLPEEAPADWIRSYKDRFGFVFADEGQEGLRNPSSFWRAVRWLSPVALFIMSGYPAPRGMEDFGAYIGLIERQELKEEHRRLADEYNRVLQDNDLYMLPDYIPGKTNPYDLPDEDPHSKFRFLSSSWKLFITNTTSPTYDDRIQQGKLAQRTLEKIVLRRDFDTALPPGSANTIGRSIPPKHHYTIERMFTPTALRVYNNQFARWKTRLFTTHRNSAGSNVPAMNARANKASQIIDFFPPAGCLHVVSEAQKRPKDHAFGEGDDRLDEKYNRDRASWFYEKSELFTQYNGLPRMKPNGWGDRLRWIMKMSRNMGCDDLGNEGTNFDTMTRADLAELFLKWSPKMQAIIALNMDWNLLRDEKVIYWFMTPIIQEMAQTVLELLGYNVFSIYSANSVKQRQEVQDAWNSQKTHKRILLASALVFGTGYNLQKDSRVGVMVDTPDNDNREKQILGRQFRGGQTLEVHFFRLTVRGTHSISRLSENLLGSLASASAFLDYESMAGADTTAEELADGNGIPQDLRDKLAGNYLDCFIRVPACEDPQDDADYQYHLIVSDEGMRYVQQERESNNKAEDWFPPTLPFTTALAGIAARSDTRRLRRVAGFPDDFIDTLIELTEDELMMRKEQRMLQYDGVDPDERYYAAKTPKKVKPSDELSRTKDKISDVGAINWPTSATDMMADIGPVTPKKTLPDIKEEEQERVNRIPNLLAANAEALKAEESDCTDFEGEPDFDSIKNRVHKHKSYRPTLDELAYCDSGEKRKITMAIKAIDSDYKAPTLGKKAKAKAKGKGKAAKNKGRAGNTIAEA